MPVRDDLDPLENLIADLFKADPVLDNIYGPYFDWNLQPQGMPYALVVPYGGGSNIYPLKGGGLTRDVIGRPIKQFSVFSKDRAKLVNPDTGLLGLISSKLEAVANQVMKGGQVCSSCLMVTSWQIKFDQSDSKALNANVWHAYGDFQFITQRTAGVL